MRLYNSSLSPLLAHAFRLTCIDSVTCTTVVFRSPSPDDQTGGPRSTHALFQVPFLAGPSPVLQARLPKFSGVPLRPRDGKRHGSHAPNLPLCGGPGFRFRLHRCVLQPPHCSHLELYRIFASRNPSDVGTWVPWVRSLRRTPEKLF